MKSFIGLKLPPFFLHSVGDGKRRQFQNQEDLYIFSAIKEARLIFLVDCQLKTFEYINILSFKYSTSQRHLSVYFSMSKTIQKFRITGNFEWPLRIVEESFWPEKSRGELQKNLAKAITKCPNIKRGQKKSRNLFSLHCHAYRALLLQRRVISSFLTGDGLNLKK